MVNFWTGIILALFPYTIFLQFLSLINRWMWADNDLRVLKKLWTEKLREIISDIALFSSVTNLRTCSGKTEQLINQSKNRCYDFLCYMFDLFVPMHKHADERMRKKAFKNSYSKKIIFWCDKKNSWRKNKAFFIYW